MQVLIVDDDMATVDVIKNSVKWKELGVSDISVSYTHLTLPTICSV